MFTARPSRILRVEKLSCDKSGKDTVSMASNIKDLRELSVDELATRRRDLKHELLNLRVQKESGQIENPARIKQARREIARIETLLTEKASALQASESAAE